MDPTVGFAACFALTLLALGATVATGLRGRVKLHLPCVGLSLVLLGTTIWFAEQLGRRLDLESAGAITPVHLALAKIATASYLLPLVSGVMTLRNRKHRKLHLRLAMLTLVLTVAAAGTGTWMLLRAAALPPA